ncbi:MAG: elongation factor P [Alphaproteobacteria bacterium]|nr:elongation factor P [Alphaproteobacteria bacterium]MCB9696475.1 elongation factor P [Alphaproteobacteria bacterium]
MYSVSDIRKGLKVEIDNQPYVVIDFQFVKPGKGQAFTRTKLKNLITGNNLDRTFKIVESLAPCDVTDVNMQFMYADAEGYNFMNLETYDQVSLPAEAVGDAKNWLIDEMQVNVLFYKGRAINIDLPNFVELEITYCEPGIKGNTATGTNKPATLSTGAIVGVPLFVEQGEWIKVDTRTGEYVERVKR